MGSKKTGKTSKQKKENNNKVNSAKNINEKEKIEKEENKNSSEQKAKINNTQIKGKEDSKEKNNKDNLKNNNKELNKSSNEKNNNDNLKENSKQNNNKGKKKDKKLKKENVEENIEKKSEEEKTKESLIEIPKEISKNVVKGILVILAIISYFLILILAHNNMKQERLIGDIEIFATTFLIAGLVVLENAYKKDNGKLAIISIELLTLAFHTLSIFHISAVLKLDFNKYVLISAGVFSIYYLLKTIITYTKAKKRYLDSLSDISEIVQNDEPVVKEAKKRTKNTDTKNK